MSQEKEIASQIAPSLPLPLSVHPAHHSDLVRAPRHQEEVAEAALLAAEAVRRAADRGDLSRRRQHRARLDERHPGPVRVREGSDHIGAGTGIKGSPLRKDR